MDIQKMKEKWESQELHEDSTLDYAISDIYRLCKYIEHLDEKKQIIKSYHKTLKEIIAINKKHIVPSYILSRIIILVEQALKG